MNIYPSSKVMPYVYKCIHRETGKIYIGSRTNKLQKLPPHLDLPRYKTSSKFVKPIFEEFDWHIVAEFFDPKDAYDFEQELIYEQWQISKEMSLNQVCYYGKESFNVIGIQKSKDTKDKMSYAKLGVSQSKQHIENRSKSLTGRFLSKEHKHNMRKPKSNTQNMRKPRSEEGKRNMSNIIDVLTPDGFVIENTTMKELCSQFNLNYGSISIYFRLDKSYKGFYKL